VEDLWDDLAATPSEIPVYDWQKEELARRKANLMNNPASGLSWGDVKRRVRSRYGR
jgi:putative addiction module component (TIGR02574 family)